MTDVTQILSKIEQGDPTVADQLLPLVYDELRKPAAAKLANEKPGQTIQATGLVHEAWVRLVRSGVEIHWNGRGHFFAAAARVMQRILVENARRKKSLKAGGHGRKGRMAKNFQNPQVAIECSLDGFRTDFWKPASHFERCGS